jgi:hypothetical protein
MRILRHLTALLLILAVGGLFQALELFSADEACPDCAQSTAQDCSQCPGCVACPGRSPAISQPDPPMNEAETGRRCSAGSDDPIVAPRLSDIFHPPKAC